ncbi:hypothetical protein L484_014865 [Morus notabilis]|uniref:Uncharacterized protein n=1 Tax=Morus notabilis TaxID=981085 RepID=W9S232_9ROSA|nr:hypothetical protein L484_014865 [Morus notabilis]
MLRKPDPKRLRFVDAKVCLKAAAKWALEKPLIDLLFLPQSRPYRYLPKKIHATAPKNPPIPLFYVIYVIEGDHHHDLELLKVDCTIAVACQRCLHSDLKPLSSPSPPSQISSPSQHYHHHNHHYLLSPLHHPISTVDLLPAIVYHLIPKDFISLLLFLSTARRIPKRVKTVDTRRKPDRCKRTASGPTSSPLAA